ncbi:hypothetical protein NUSPORA_01899 [Nucleospora cyclopteri]
MEKDENANKSNREKLNKEQMFTNEKLTGRQRRVSFCPAPKVEYFEESSNTVEQNEIEVNLFKTQQFVEEELIEDFERRKSFAPRKSLDPLAAGDFEIIEEAEKNSKKLEIKEEYKDTPIVLKEKPKRDTQIDDYMHSLGIRFLDRIITNMCRKDSESNSCLRESYKESLWMKFAGKPRAEFFRGCIKFMLMQMKHFQEQINKKQATLDVEKINTEGLKKLRNESRNKVKLEWYTFRRLQETNFMVNLRENENLLVSLKLQKINEQINLQKEIDQLKHEFTAVSNENSSIKSLIKQNEVPNTEELEDLQYALMKKSNDLEILLEDKDELMKRKFEQEMEERIIKDRIKEAREDVEKLKNTILGKNADDNQLQEMKNYSRRFENVFNCRLVKLKSKMIILEMFNHEFICYLNSISKVTKFTAKKLSNCSSEMQNFQHFFTENMLDLNSDSKEENKQFSMTTGNLSEKTQKGFSTNENAVSEENKRLSLPSMQLNEAENQILSTAVHKNTNRKLSISTAQDSKKTDFLSNTVNLENTLDAFMLQKLNEEQLEEVKRPKIGNTEQIFILNSPLNLRIFVHKILFRFSLINNLRKEIEILKENCKIDTFYVRKRIYLRFYLKTFDPRLDIVDVFIDKDFKLFSEKKEVSDLRVNLRGLTDFISNILTSI